MGRANSMIRFIVVLAGMLAVSALSSYAQERTLDDLVRDSQVIVIGNVKNVQSKWDNQKRNIWTYVTISSQSYLKGDITQGELVVRILGGAANDTSQYVSGSPRFDVGEHVLTFLGKDVQDFYYVNGWEDGKYTYRDGAWIGKNSEFPGQLVTQIKSIVKLQSKQ
ncbi:MAG: hypothetical protein M1469_08065 [Bacteroidetes bacterium]|nr:hypothetical protein [Bacteroidota bacterium]